VRLVLKEWQFSDGSHSLNSYNLSSRQSSVFGSSTVLPSTGRKINITVVEGKDLFAKEKSGKCDPYVKLQYGKVGLSFLHSVMLYDLRSNILNIQALFMVTLYISVDLFRLSRKRGLCIL
jgi:hypothetical protein